MTRAKSAWIVALLLVVAAALLPGSPAAADTTPPAPCSGYLITDHVGDQFFPGFQEGVGAGTAPADTDIQGLFFNYDDSTGTLTANIQIANLDGTLPDPQSSQDGIYFYVWYTFESGTPADGSPADPNPHFVKAVLDHAGTYFTYGFENTATGGYVNDGVTKGQFFNGAPGVVQIQIPASEGGALGDKLSNVLVDVDYITGANDVAGFNTHVDIAPDGGDQATPGTGSDYTAMTCADDQAAG